MDLSNILQIIENSIVLLGGIFGILWGLSPKFRNAINYKLRNTEAIKNIDTKMASVTNDISKLNTLMSENSIKVDDQRKLLQQLNDKLNANTDTTILTLKYEILDICHRANKYNGITPTDRAMLCELYDCYVNKWHENHYVKSEADRIIKNTQIIDTYPTIK